MARSALSAFTAILFLISSNPAFAGGAWSKFHVKKLTLLSETDYVLLLTPASSNNAEFKNCEQIEVQGTLGRLDGLSWIESLFYSRSPTKEGHIAAIKYMQEYEGRGGFIYFGEMGQGFAFPEKNNPCKVVSLGLGRRSFEQHDGEDGGITILSYFHVL